MTNKRYLLLLIGILTVALAVVNQLPSQSPIALARVYFQQSPLETPTPTRVFKVINQIIHPQSGDAVSGVVEIWGYALIQTFRKYDVHIAVAGSENWRWLQTSSDVISDGPIYRLDTRQYADGRYDLRVRAVRDDGNYSESFLRNLEIRNANPPTLTPAFNPQGTQLPTSTPTLVTPTGTPTPEFISNISDGPGLFAPYTNQVVRGRVRIIGTANGKPNVPFEHFELALARAGLGQWEVLEASERQVWQDTLYEWDTSQWPDGAYDLRLRIVFANGNYDEYQVRNLFVANYTKVQRPTATPTPPTKGIFAPRSGAVITGTISITGTATILNFQRWELAWSNSGQEEWSLLLESTTPQANALLARLDLSQLPVGLYDLRLRVFDLKGQYADYFTRRLQIVAPTPTPTLAPPGGVITQTQP
jgi:hypothetical protein